MKYSRITLNSPNQRLLLPSFFFKARELSVSEALQIYGYEHYFHQSCCHVSFALKNWLTEIIEQEDEAHRSCKLTSLPLGPASRYRRPSYYSDQRCEVSKFSLLLLVSSSLVLRRSFWRNKIAMSISLKSTLTRIMHETVVLDYCKPTAISRLTQIGEDEQEIDDKIGV